MEADLIKKSNNRLSNIELLRIISMLMVITLHFLGRGGVHANAELFTPAYYISSIWDAIAIVSVNIYVMISGYFLVTSKFKIQKLVDLVITVLMYSFLLYMLSVIMGIKPFSILDFISAIFPILTNQYWFVSVYVGLYILHPFLNIAIDSMNRKQHTALNFLLFLLFTFHLPSKALGQNGYSIVWMICLYIFASYIRLYYEPSRTVKFNQILFYVVPTLLLPVSKFIIAYLSTIYSESILNYSTWFYKNNSIFVLSSSIALFIIFLNVEIKNAFAQKIISSFSGLTFGVYLSHNNPSIRDELWGLFDIPSFINRWCFIPAGISIILVIFLISSFIEFCRKKVHFIIINSTFYNKVFYKVEKFYSGFLKSHRR